jgi:hypothetical protein
VGRHVCGIDPPSPHLLSIAGMLGFSSYVREQTWDISRFCSGEAGNYESVSCYEIIRAPKRGRNTELRYKFVKNGKSK